jgi:hypothetical protein
MMTGEAPGLGESERTKISSLLYNGTLLLSANEYVGQHITMPKFAKSAAIFVPFHGLVKLIMGACPANKH